jgi:hypothetical protein
MNSDSTLIATALVAVATITIAIALMHHYQGGGEVGLSEALFSFNIGSNQSNDEEKEKEATDDINTAIICANCGKEGAEDDMNSCNKCDLVQYCNAACKKKHKSKHKKKCEKRAAELFDEALFKEHPGEECLICMLPLSVYDTHTGITFHSCCGKEIMRKTGGKNMELCPFCKTPNTMSEEEHIKRLNKLMKKGNAGAFNLIAGYYAQGILGMSQDQAKANELWLKAGELGCAEAYYNLGCSYEEGTGVESDMKKAMHYYELAAMNGDVQGRHNIGCSEGYAGNLERAYKHFKLAARAGYTKSLDLVKHGFMNGHVTKEEYAKTLREYQKSQDEAKSDMRDKAGAIRDRIISSG